MIKIKFLQQIVKPRLTISFIIALVITYILFTFFNPIVLEEPLNYLNVSNTVNDFSFSSSIAPSYFDSLGKVYVALYSPNSKLLKEFTMEMSLDKNSWVEVPLYSSQPNKKDYTKFADLGYVNLNQVRINFYGRSSIPPQQLELPPGTSKKDFLNSFNGNIVIKPILTPKDWTLLILVFMSTLGAIYGVLNSILPEKYNR